MPDYTDQSAASGDMLLKAALSKAMQQPTPHDGVEIIYCPGSPPEGRSQLPAVHRVPTDH